MIEQIARWLEEQPYIDDEIAWNNDIATKEEIARKMSHILLTAAKCNGLGGCKLCQS